MFARLTKKLEKRCDPVRVSPERLRDAAKNNEIRIIQGHIAAYNQNNPEEAAALQASLNAVDSTGHTALVYATWGENTEIVRILINAKADIHIASSLSYKALGHAVVNGNSDIVNLLIEAGADVNYADRDNETALHRAAFEGHVDRAQALINVGANVNHRGKFGNTPLMWAIKCSPEKRKAQIVQTLIKAKADIYIANDDGETALSTARRQSNWNDEVIACLKKYSRELSIVAVCMGSSKNATTINTHSLFQPNNNRPIYCNFFNDVRCDDNLLGIVTDFSGLTNNTDHENKYSVHGIW